MCPDILEPFSSSTLIDSTPGVLAAWERFGREYGFDPVAAADAGHGRRLTETLGELFKLDTPEQVAVRPAIPFPHSTPATLGSPDWGRTGGVHRNCCDLMEKKKKRMPSCASRMPSWKVGPSHFQAQRRCSRRSMRAARRLRVDGPSLPLARHPHLFSLAIITL